MSCHGAGRWARTGEVFGVFEEALAGGILPQAVGEAGHGVEPAPVDGEGAHAVEGRGLAIDGASGRPGGAPGQLVLADLIRGQRGGVCGAAEEGDEMGDPAAGGALGPELPDLVVLEVGVAELAQGRPLGAEGARGRRRHAGSIGGVGRAGVVRGHGSGPSCRTAADVRPSVDPRSVGRDREAECALTTGSRGDRWGPLDLVRAERRIGRRSTAADGEEGPRHGCCAGAYRPRLPRVASVSGHPPHPPSGPRPAHGARIPPPRPTPPPRPPKPRTAPRVVPGAGLGTGVRPPRARWRRLTG